MLSNKGAIAQRRLSVAPSPIEIVLADDEAGPLALILPPLDDLEEMESLKGGHFSLRAHAEMRQIDLGQYFSDELATLERKRARFADSPTFLAKLADMAELAGNREAEFDYLRAASALRNDPNVQHRIGDNLIARQKLGDASRLFGGLDLNSDEYANLRLAYLKIQEGDLDGALRHATKAVEVAPDSFGCLLLEGALRLTHGQFERAIRSFRVATEVRPNSSALYANMAVAFAFLKRPEKALAALRRAVALDPLNQNAVAFLADLSFRERRYEDSVPSLRLFLQFEQRDAAMWARLARALLELGDTNESIAALKKQGSLVDSPAVWNNLGVAYCRRNDGKKAFESFKHAMDVGTEDPSRDFFLAARNLAVLMSKEFDPLDTIRFVEAVVAEDGKHDFALMAEHDLSDLYTVEIAALHRMGKYREALSLSQAILGNAKAATNLKAWVVSGVVANLALSEEDQRSAVAFANKYEYLLRELPPRDKGRLDQLLNNIAFAHIEAGLLEQAERYLSLLTNAFHKEPYPTATLGLFHFRKGHYDRAEQLYEEAVSLSLSPKDKARIRQKLNLEMARRYLEAEPQRAVRFLERAVNAKNGDVQLANIAGAMKKRLQGVAKD